MRILLTDCFCPPPLPRSHLPKRLDEGDYDAVYDYQREDAERYKVRGPDHSLAARVAAIPWSSPHANVILFVGFLSVGKGVQALIAALPRVLQTHPDSHIVIVGSGPNREPLEGESLFIYR